MKTRTMTVVSGKLVVSKHSDGSLFVDTRIEAVLPGCRKAALLSFSPSAKRVIARPLFGSNGEATLNPVDWKAYLMLLPVEASDIFPMDINPDVVSQARLHAAGICTCPAVTNPAFCHPDFRPVFDGFVVAERA